MKARLPHQRIDQALTDIKKQLAEVLAKLEAALRLAYSIGTRDGAIAALTTRQRKR